jgi:hypothetical protein
MAETIGSKNNQYSTSSYTFLCKYDETEMKYKKFLPIQTCAALGGDPDTVDISDLDDNNAKELLGQQRVEKMQFTVGYKLEYYEKIEQESAEGTIHKWAVVFGKNGEYGVFVWEGQCNGYIDGFGINEQRKMQFSIAVAGEKPKLDKTVTIDTTDTDIY